MKTPSRTWFPHSEVAAAYLAAAALRDVESGNRKEARAEARVAVKLAPNRDVHAIAALALARAGDIAGAEILAAELEKSFPLDTLVQKYWLPTVRAAVCLERKNPDKAIKLLKATIPIELSGPTNLAILLCPVYVRGQACLMQHDGKQAAAEFQKFSDHRGIVWNFPWAALARLGLARAYAEQGDIAKARTSSPCGKMQTATPPLSSLLKRNSPTCRKKSCRLGSSLRSRVLRSDWNRSATMGMAAPGRRDKHKKEHLYFMSKQDEAGLILKLYELRREEKMRKARNWYFQEFNPQTIADVQNAMYGENSAYFRMVTSYWDMAAALVNNGAISMELFNDSNGEHMGVFAKVEPLLDEIRATFGVRFFASMEKLVDATPDGRKRTAASREQMKAIRAQFEARMAKSAKS